MIKTSQKTQSWEHWFKLELQMNYVTLGQVLKVSDNVVIVKGLTSVMIGEVVYVLYTYTNKTNKSVVGEIVGQALNLNNDGTIGVILFGDETLILAGNIVFGSGRLLSVPVGASTLGLVVNPIGNVELEGANKDAICTGPGKYDASRVQAALNTTGNTKFMQFVNQVNLRKPGTFDISAIPASSLEKAALVSKFLHLQWVHELKNMPYYTLSTVEKKAPGIIPRSSVNRALYTGIKGIDGLIPVGRGQRELIIGDRQTGKTTIAIDTILRQNTGRWLPDNKVYDVFSIYVAIGQKRSFVRQLFTLIGENNRLDSSLIVAATASEPAALQFLAPYTGATFGEAFRDFKKDAVIIYDDLSKHAVAYRQMSLLLRRPPGREAYPGDVFYLHSRLLERAAQMKEGGSLTALPVIETQGGDVTAYIPTNVISITDGQIFLETEMFHKGLRPAIHMGLSVSRVGASCQLKSMKQVAGSIKLQLAQYRELESFASFGGELDATTMLVLNRGMRLVELLKQAPYKPYDVHEIICSLYAGSFGLLDTLPVNQVQAFEQTLLKTLSERPDFVTMLRKDGQLNAVNKRLLNKLIFSIIKNLR